MNDTNMIHVVGAVLVRDGRFLAAQRGPAKSLADLWEFPGGKIEVGETARQALARELREELRVEASIGQFIARSEYDYPFGAVRLDAYFCSLTDGEPQLTEHQAIRWLASDELDDVEWAPADIPIIDELKKRPSRANQ